MFDIFLNREDATVLLASQSTLRFRFTKKMIENFILFLYIKWWANISPRSSNREALRGTVSSVLVWMVSQGTLLVLFIVLIWVILWLCSLCCCYVNSIFCIFKSVYTRSTAVVGFLLNTPTLLSCQVIRPSHGALIYVCHNIIASLKQAWATGRQPSCRHDWSTSISAYWFCKLFR